MKYKIRPADMVEAVEWQGDNLQEILELCKGHTVNVSYEPSTECEKGHELVITIYNNPLYEGSYVAKTVREKMSYLKIYSPASFHRKYEEFKEKTNADTEI